MPQVLLSVILTKNQSRPKQKTEILMRANTTKIKIYSVTIQDAVVSLALKRN